MWSSHGVNSIGTELNLELVKRVLLHHPTIMKLGAAPFATVLSLGLGQLARAGITCPDTSGDGPKLGAVASESAICSRVGTRLLEDGGNAVDALVGTVFCVGVMGMYHSGIGGGGFMLVRAANGSYEFVDFRETAPAAATQDMYNGNVNASLFGGLAR